MDRSFLFDPNLIRCSRNFVCVRLSTYESQSEADFTAKLLGPNAVIENTTFAILSPDGKALTSVVRSPRRLYGSAADLVRHMNEIHRRYRAKGNDLAIPELSHLRLALNVAASDQQRLIVCLDYRYDSVLKTQLWTKELIGRYLFVRAGVQELELHTNFAGAKSRARLLIIDADQFGLAGTIAASYSGPAESPEFISFLQKHVVIPLFNKVFWSHVEKGKKDNVFWETAVPVTDSYENVARRR